MRRISIVQGEHAVVDEPGVVVTTLLGSCVAVCLQDPVAHVGGMNHFLLGEPERGRRIAANDMHRYGVHAMELLINAMMAKGATRSRLRAHIYGGANIIAGLGRIGSDNAAFVRRFMEAEEIAVGHCDLGGAHARKVEFMPYEGKARARAVTDPPPPPAMPPAVEAACGELELF